MNYLFMKKRNVVAVVLLPIVTCGIYGLYWYFAAFDELKSQYEMEFPGETVPSPVKAFFLGIITCGIYQIYAYYLYAQAAERLANRRGSESYSAVLIVVLMLFVPFLPKIFLQMEFNGIVDITETQIKQQWQQPQQQWQQPQQQWQQEQQQWEQQEQQWQQQQQWQEQLPVEQEQQPPLQPEQQEAGPKQ